MSLRTRLKQEPLSPCTIDMALLREPSCVTLQTKDTMRGRQVAHYQTNRISCIDKTYHARPHTIYCLNKKNSLTPYEECSSLQLWNFTMKVVVKIGHKKLQIVLPWQAHSKGCALLTLFTRALDLSFLNIRHV